MIVGAAYVNTWLGVAAAVVAVAGIVWWLMQEAVPASRSPCTRLDVVDAAGAPPRRSSSRCREPRRSPWATERPRSSSSCPRSRRSSKRRPAPSTTGARTPSRRRSRSPGASRGRASTVRGEVGADDPWLADRGRPPHLRRRRDRRRGRRGRRGADPRPRDRARQPCVAEARSPVADLRDGATPRNSLALRGAVERPALALVEASRARIVVAAPRGSRRGSRGAQSRRAPATDQRRAARRCPSAPGARRSHTARRSASVVAARPDGHERDDAAGRASATCASAVVVREDAPLEQRASTRRAASRSAPNTCSYAACQVRTCTSAIAAASLGRARRTSHGALLAGGGGDELRHGVDLRGVSVPLNAGMTPPPTSTWCFTIASAGFSWSRFGPIVPVACAAFSVWQLAQFAWKIDLPSFPAAGAAAAPRHARRRGDVGGDVLRVLARDEVLRHRRRRLADLVEHDVLDRALLEALLAVGRERVVEVRAGRPVRPGGGEHVAAGALRREELAAVPLVAGEAPCRPCRSPPRGRAAAARARRGAVGPPHYAGGALPVVPSFETASSRVG